MNKVYLFRDDQNSECVRSFLITPTREFQILERPWLNNQRNISCIPPGTYRVKYLRRSASGRYRNCYHVLNVPGRTGILIHQGNIADHSHGCLLIGKRRGWLNRKRAVLASRSALKDFVRTMGKKDFLLTIIG